MDNLEFEIARSVEGLWLSMSRLQTGDSPAESDVPDRYVKISRRGSPLLRVDIYSSVCEFCQAEQVAEWRGLVFAGVGVYLFVISPDDKTLTMFDLDSCFHEIRIGEGYLLVASGEHIYRFGEDGTALWQSEVAIDGVRIQDVADGRVRGEGDWDPPHGWKPFELDLNNGKPLGSYGGSVEVAAGKVVTASRPEKAVTVTPAPVRAAQTRQAEVVTEEAKADGSHINVGLLCVALGGAIGAGVSWVGGFPLGTGTAIGVVGGMGLVVLMIPLLAFWERTERPDCRCGKTKGADLECEFSDPDGVGTVFEPENPEACGYHYLCPHCQTRWNVSDSICYEILSSNSARPWKRRTRMGKWVDV